MQLKTLHATPCHAYYRKQQGELQRQRSSTTCSAHRMQRSNQRGVQFREEVNGIGSTAEQRCRR